METNKGDEENPDVRCRWVGKDFKTKGARDDLFAATPPLEAKKTLISKAASQIGKTKIKKFGFIYIRKAYFHAPVRWEIYVKLPAEFLEPGEEGKVCGLLNFSLYGTRDAAQNGEEEYAGFMESIGFVRGLANPC